MKTENKTKLWDFLEANMTNYFQDKRIYRIDRLECFIEETLPDEDELAEHGLVGYSDQLAHEEIIILTDECFAEALENFTKKTKMQLAFEALLKFEKVRVTDKSYISLLRDNEGIEQELPINSIESSGCISLYSDNIGGVIYDINIDEIEFIA